MGSSKNCTIVIPARAGSSRFKNKPLAILQQKTLIERVWHLARAVHCAQRVIIATDSEAISQAALAFGAEVVLTPDTLRNGSERTAYVAQQCRLQDDVIVNLQGDAVLTPPWIIDDLVQALSMQPTWTIVTPSVALRGQEYQAYVARKKSGRASGTTVVFDTTRRALYFSKAVIPNWRQNPSDADETQAFQHMGVYAYRADALARYAQLPMGNFEKIEQLEQLRWLEHGYAMHVVPVDIRGRTLWSIDYPEDLDVAKKIIEQEGELV